VCTRRIEELSAELTLLDARRSDLAVEVSGSQPNVPGPAELAQVREDIERALRDGALPERKAVMQAVVAEIRVRDRGHIRPVFRVIGSWTTVWIGALGRTRTCAPGSGGRRSIL